MTSTAVLTPEAVLDEALTAFGGNQSELSRQLGVSMSSISRWRAKRSRPEVESALLLARFTSFARNDVLQAFGHDPARLGLLEVSPDNHTSSQLRELGRLLRQVTERVDILAGLRRVAPSQLHTNTEGFPSTVQNTEHYDYQERAPGRVLKFPHLGVPVLTPLGAA